MKRREQANQKTIPMQGAVLTRKEAAEYLRVTTRTLRNWVIEGRLRSARIGSRRVVFLRSELERVLNDAMQNAAA
jgi:excisionase family DNA binding protein